MTKINIQESSNPAKYLVITQQKDPETLITTRVLITDNANNRINVIDIGRGPIGPQGLPGPQGPPGQSAVFDVLSISSGGTNNSSFIADKIIYYDGSKLSSTNYSVNDLLNNVNAITGIIEGSGIYKELNGSNVTIGAKLGDGLTTNLSNQIIVDDTIARKYELSLGSISGIVPIDKGGTNNSLFNTNRLVYYDGNQLTSFPLETGRIVTSGSTISIIAGSGLVGGGSVSIPNGSVVINISNSPDIIVSDSAIELSTTGIPGWYNKVLTDAKGRVISGLSLSSGDVIDALGYTPWHPNNDGSGSLLDADLLDGRDGSYYLNFSNFTGSIQTSILPDIIVPGTFTKVTTNSKGLVLNGTGLNFSDVITGLNYIPFSTSGGTIDGNVDINGNFAVQNGNVVFEDNLPLFSYDNASMLPTDPRGFSFEYGNVIKKTGLLAYFPADQQLKLIVDIMSEGDNDIDGGDGENNFNGDIDGGDASSIYVLGSIVGEEAIVLLEHIADQKYISLTQTQSISGVKTFYDAINVYNSLSILQGVGYGGPPLFIGSNTGLVASLNSDLLDGNHGSYYRDANNLTGTLNYNNTTVSNLAGAAGYIAKFNNLTNNPSRTVDSSIVRQSGQTIIVENGSFSVGDNLYQQTKTATVGSNNTASGNFSMAIGSGAYSWLNNQLSIGAFVELSGSTPLGRGQSSTASIGYYGDTGGVYQTLKPIIQVPNNKTVLYNIELLFSKFGSSGLAAMSFQSGLIKNINNNCYIVNSGNKLELYNNSQIRDYIHTAQNSQYGLTDSQIVSVTSAPIKTNNGQIKNLDALYKIRIDPSTQSGTFNKLFNGDIVVTLSEPISSGRYTSTINSKNLLVQAYDHGCVTGCMVSFVPTSGTNVLPISGMYEVLSIPNNHSLIINDISWSGHYNNGKIDIPTSSINTIDNRGNLSFSGSFGFNSTSITSCVPSPLGRVFPGMSLSVSSGFSNSPSVVSVTSNSILLNIPYTGSSTNLLFATSGYSAFKLNQSSNIFFEGGEYAQVVARTGSVDVTSSGLRIYTDGFTGDSVVSPLKIYALINNTGLLYLTEKRNYAASYQRSQASFNTYTLSYTQYPSVNNTGHIVFSGNNVISGYAPNYNPYFRFLSATNSFSGILTSGSNIITSCTPSQSGKLLAGMILYSNVSGFPSTGNVITVSPTGNSIELDVIFSGISANSLITYSGNISNTNYPILVTGTSGLSVGTTYSPPDTGVFLTGVAIMYHGTGVSNINISTLETCNLQSGVSGFLTFTSASTGLKPVDSTYRITSTSLGSFSINNFHLMPDSGIAATGLLSLNLNKDHGFLPPSVVSYLSQDIPISFRMSNTYSVASATGEPIYTANELTDRTPDSGLYEIKAVTGYTILISDHNRTLVAENGKQLLLDTLSSGIYQIQSSSGNRLSIGYIHKYFNLHDSLYVSFNDSTYNQNFRITGVRDFGTYGFYDLKSISGTLTGSQSLPSTGIARYMGHCSGTIGRSYNLIYFNYDGDTYEHWQRDTSGKYVNPPLTGYFTVYDSPSLCFSGNLCIHITGISDITSIRPKQAFYFDFIDGHSSLDGYYAVNDKIYPNLLSLSVPYNTNFLNNSGLVYIIDSTDNIKSNRNPNQNNTFNKANSTTSIASFSGPLTKFNTSNNRWKYGYVLQQNLLPQRLQPQFAVYGSQYSTSTSTDVIILSENPLSSQIQYSLDKVTFYDAESSTIDTYTGQLLYLKFIISGGAGKWSNDIDSSCPRVNIIGLESYNIFTQDRSFNSTTQNWEIIATVAANTKTAINKTITITVADISERITKTILLNRKQKLTATNIENVKYGYANDVQNWYMLLEAYGGTLSSINQPLVQVISGFPNDAGVQVSLDYLNYPSGWWGISLQGLPPATTGIYKPVIRIRENSDTTEPIYVTGTLYVTDTDQVYSLNLRTLSDNINIPYLNDNVDDFGFLVPVLTNTNANFVVNFNNNDSLTIGTPTIEYRPNLKAFTYRVNLSGVAGFYQPTFIVNINQPSGIIEEVLFTKSTGLSITVYNPISIDASQYTQPIVFEENTPWSFSFYVQDGGVAFRENIQPYVSIGNTPNIGTYNQFPLEYNIGKQYDSSGNRWLISVTGIPDQFGNFVVSTGLYNLNIYTEDYTSSNSNNLAIKIDPSRSLYIKDYTYATPNNGFEFGIDLDFPRSTNSPSVEFPSNLKDSLISSSLTYGKYDPDITIWEYQYSGSPITEKWDTRLQLNGNNLSVQAKGILNDKIYVAGKVETIETENAFSVFTPLQIVDINPAYDFNEGSAWSLQFSTIGGLENPLYPPRITMNGFPPGSPCSGYSPQAGSQPACFTQRTWNNAFKKWVFKFDGIPLCLRNVQFTINITATDIIDNETFGTDTESTIFTYKPIEAHPGPSAPGGFSTNLTPLCLPYSDSKTYKTNVRNICPSPTGITGLITWGSLPPGLTFSDSRNGQYQSPWSDLTGGTVTIQGTPTTFANGGDYSESFNIAVVDARGLSGVLRNITFKDVSAPILPSPTEMTIYFSGLDYIYSPSLPVGQQTIPGGALIVDRTQDMVRPPASNISMQCFSRLPHNQCLYSTGIYTIHDANTIRLSGPGTLDSIPSIKRIGNLEKIYIEFDNQVSSSLNKEYVCSRVNSSVISITSSGHGIASNISGQIGILKTQDNIKSLAVSAAGYGGNPPTIPTTTTITGIMGDGNYATSFGVRGFRGRLKPAFSGAPISGIYRSNFAHHNDMSISGIPGENTNVYSIEFTNCYETGYLRVSGVIVPSPILEITDPPPADRPFAFDSQGYAFSARIAYGDSTTRNNAVNQRSGRGIKTYIYSPQTQITGFNTTLSDVSTSQQFGGFSNATINYSSPILTSGLVFGMRIRHDSPDVFPTYDKYAMPSLTNEYFWVQRAGSTGTPIVESTFPPHVPVYSGNLLFTSGTPAATTINIVGGFIPTGQWNFGTYLNYTSGFIQTPINNIVVTGNYVKAFSSGVLTVNINNNPFVNGDFIKINAYSDSTSLPLPFSTTGLQLTNVVGNNLYISGMTTNASMSGRVDITYLAQISSGSDPFQVRIDHGSGQSGFYPVNKTIDIISLSNDLVSTQNYLMPRDVRLRVVSGTNTYCYAGIDSIRLSGTFTNGSPTITNCTVNPSLILKSGYNLYANIVGMPNPATVASVTSDSITLLSNFTGTTTNNVEVIHSGDNTVGYYSGLVSTNSGICEIREHVYNNNNMFDLSFGPTIYNNSPGYTYAAITGYSDNLNGKYLYKVITAENTGLPSITTSGWNNKKFSRTYELIGTRPLTIIGDPNIFTNINIDNNVWNLEFHVTGGFIPKSNSNLVVEIDGLIHTFTTGVNYISESGARINITANSAINWSDYFLNNSPSQLKVFDRLSSDTKSLTADFGA